MKSTDGKRKKIADIEAEWEEKMAFFSSQIEGLNQKVQNLEERLLALETKKSHTGEKWKIIRDASVLKCKKFSSFSKEKMYPNAKVFFFAILQKFSHGFAWMFGMAKAKSKQFGYAKTACCCGLFLGMVVLLYIQPWKQSAIEKSETACNKKVDNPSPQVSFTRTFEEKQETRLQQDPYVYQKEPVETKKQPPQFSPEGERDGLPLISVLIQKSQEGDLSHRFQAIEELGKMNSPSANRQLCNLMKDSNIDIRWYSLRTLGNTKGDRSSLLALFEILYDKKENIEFRREALRSIASLGNKFVEFTSSEKKALLEMLLDTSCDEELRSNAAYVLSSIGYASISGKIVPLLKDPSSLVREMVAYTLGSFSYPNADGELIEMMKSDESVQVRLAAVQALSKINIKVGNIAPQLFEQWKNETEDCVKKEIKESLKRLSRIAGFPGSLKEQMEKYIKD